MKREQALKFLEQQGCLKSFLCYEKYAGTTINNEVEEDFITQAFHWQRTQEGYSYWGNINSEFKKYYKVHNIKDGDLVYADCGDQKFIMVYNKPKLPCITYGICGEAFWSFKSHSSWAYNHNTLRKANENELKMFIFHMKINGYTYANGIFTKELVFKDGDIVYAETGKQHFIFVYGDRYKYPSIDDIKEDWEFNHNNNWNYDPETLRLATTEEVKLFNETLRENNLMWDKDKKKVVRWRSDVNNYYYYIDNIVNIASSCEIGDCEDDELYEAGNYFANAELAKRKLEEIKKVFNNE